MKIAERWFVMAGVVLVGAIALVGIVLAVYAAWLFHDLPDGSELADYRPPTATRVYAGDGTLIGEYSDERRIYVSYEQIPETVRNAFLSAEDSDFFNHGGIDVSGLGRAMFKNVFNAVSGRRLEGGSTITQQVAKNVLLTNEPSLNRKIKEAILANRLEAALSKEQILELYLNEIFLGYRSYGVAAAAYNYFGKSLEQLTPAEAAYLAALPKGPNNYHPRRHHDAAVARRNWVLAEMGQNGVLDRQQVARWQAEPLIAQAAPARTQYRDADYFVEEARRQAIKRFGEDAVLRGGYYMRTTLDPKLQTAARQALMRGLENYDRRHGWRGAWGTTDFAEGWQKKALSEGKPPERPSWVAAAVESAAGGNVRVRLANNENGEKTGSVVGSDVSWAAANGHPLKQGDLIFVEPVGGQYGLRQIPAVNGAMVVVDPNTGQTLAMVGGYSFGLSSFNRATQAERQPGSTFKPFVYAAALEGDFSPDSIILDAPISFGSWRPENYSKRFYGPQSLRRGLELSRNVMTVRLAQAVGMNNVVALAEKMGVSDKLQPNLSVSLGAGETTPFKITGAYSAFVNGGRRIDPYLIEMVQDRDGETILAADNRRCRECTQPFSGQASPRLPVRGEQVIDPVTAYQITTMLEGVVKRGTATSASDLGNYVGGKTGTTNSYRSAWFVGVTSDLVVGVFIGFDDNRSLGSGEAGGTAAVPIFRDFMQVALKERPARPWVKPRNAIYRIINGIEEAFRPALIKRKLEEAIEKAKLGIQVDIPGTMTNRPDRGPANVRAEPVGPRTYEEDQQQRTPSGPAAPPVPVIAPPPKKEPAEDLSGLY